jgi:hypothetical protein
MKHAFLLDGDMPRRAKDALEEALDYAASAVPEWPVP